MRRGLQDLPEAEVSAAIGAQLHERRPDDSASHRNGYRERVLTTQVGDLTLAIPKLRQGSFFPNWLEPRRRVDKTLYALVMEAYTGGISTRKVDALVEALGGAIGINSLGYREVLCIAVGDTEAEGFWRQFLGSLKERGLTGTRLVISDAHLGLTAAIKRMFQGWPGHGRRRYEGGVRDPGTGSGPRPLAAGHRDAAQAVPHRCAGDRGCQRRRAGLPALPAGALAQDLEQQEEWQLERRRFFSETTMAKIPEPEEPLELTNGDAAGQPAAAIN